MATGTHATLTIDGELVEGRVLMAPPQIVAGPDEDGFCIVSTGGISVVVTYETYCGLIPSDKVPWKKEGF